MAVFALLLAPVASSALAGCQQGEEGLSFWTWDESRESGEAALERLARPYEGDALRVLWWNTQFGALASEIEERDAAENRLGLATDSLISNLAELTLPGSALEPDLAIIGEYVPAIQGSRLGALLRSRYPYFHYRPWNSRLADENGIGIAVFSKYPMTSLRVAEMDWTPVNVSMAEREAYRAEWTRSIRGNPATLRRYTRTYEHLVVHAPEREMHLVPVHLVQPWNHLAAAVGKARTGASIVFSRNHPLAHQAARLREYLNEDFGSSFENDDLLMIGDFNIPKSLGLETFGFRSIGHGLTEAFEGEPYTFPAFSSPLRMELPYRFKQFKLDHAFTSPNLRTVAAEVLPLQGSDHYPLYVITERR